jgi:hypothetical protein
MAEWHIGLAAVDDAALAAAVTGRFRAIRDDHFGDGAAINADLGVEVRALRRSEGWCIFLLLTPWMLARIFLPERDPALPLPAGWCAADRAAAPYVVIGPALEIELCGGRQRAHLNYDAVLGHHLVQPLVQAMDGFACADDVFFAWNGVLAARARIMEERQRDCPWQRELSRREFLGRLGGASG